jgi:hypothetical protein
MRSVVDRNVVMRRMSVLDVLSFINCNISICAMLLSCNWPDGAAVLSRVLGELQSVCTEMCSGMFSYEQQQMADISNIPREIHFT